MRKTHDYFIFTEYVLAIYYPRKLFNKLDWCLNDTLS